VPRKTYPKTQPAMADVCRCCPHRAACTKISALHNLPGIIPGYILLGTQYKCPDGFVEPVIETETPGPKFK